MVKVLATKYKGLRFNSRMRLVKWIFLFLSSFPLLSLSFTHLFWCSKCLIFAHFTTYRYSFPFSHNKFSNGSKYINSTIAAICEQIYCFRRPRTRRIAPAEFFSCSLPYSFLRSHAAVLEIPLIEYPMSLSLYGWGCHIGVTPPPPPPSLSSSSSERPASYTAGQVDHEKRNTGVS